MTLDDPAACAVRANAHAATARWLAKQNEEWSAVVFFYSAYHLVRASLIGDPIFNDFERLKKLNQHLIKEDRFTSRHKGRRNAREPQFGVNELVHLLYPSIRIDYEALHVASLSVRYGTGLVAPIEEIQRHATAVRSAFDSGHLVAH